VFFVGEWLILLAALAAAVRLRAGSFDFDPDGLFWLKGIVTVMAVQVSFYYAEIYDEWALRSRMEFFLRLGQAFVAATFLLTLLYYVAPVVRVEPRTLLLALPLSAAGVMAWHGAQRWAARTALSDPVLILGSGPTARQIASELLRRPSLGYRLVGLVGGHPDEVRTGAPGSPPVVGVTADLHRLVADEHIDLIVVALEDRRSHLPVDALLRCRTDGVKVEDAPSFFERLTGKILTSDLRPSWFVFSPGFHKPPLPLAMKRALEAVLAALLLAALSPLLLVLLVLIRLESRGPAIFRQSRVGLRGRTFDLYKLRTMRLDAEAATGPVWAAPEDDPRITRLGRFLRTLRLDELPQFVNVLRGEMSFVGPRPERPHFVEKLRQVIPYYEERHTVQPGITGWAQVKFGYGSTIEDSERKLQFDLYYVKNMSLLLDLAIVLDTFKVMLLGRGAR
jgi:sugar transferase (PEP-CTERM system associated)